MGKLHIAMTSPKLSVLAAWAATGGLAACHDGVLQAPDAGAPAASRIVFPATIDVGEVACGASKVAAVALENPGESLASFVLTPRSERVEVVPRQGQVVAGAKALISASLRVPGDAVPGASVQEVVTASSLDLQQDIVVKAIAVGTQFSLTTTSHQFGAVPVGESATLTVSVTNVGNREGQVRFTSTDAALSGQVVGDAFANIAPGQSADILVRFSPVGPGQLNAQLGVVAAVNGCGLPGQLQVQGLGI